MGDAGSAPSQEAARLEGEGGEPKSTDRSENCKLASKATPIWNHKRSE